MGLTDKIDNLKYEMMDDEGHTGARIKVIGVGGAGCNTVARIAHEGLKGVEFYALDTDLQALSACTGPTKLQLGAKMTNGLGAGANAEMGKQAALEMTDQIADILHGADMVFVTAGLGGGTGTGAAPVVATLAREMGALTIAVVYKPFRYEGKWRMRVAEEGLSRLAASLDTVISIPNDRLIALAPEDASFVDGLRIADDVLRQAVQGISDIMVTPGLINRDFADIRAVMSGMGYAVLGTATATGANAAVDAAKAAISSPLLEDCRISGSRGILINVTFSKKLSMKAMDQAAMIIYNAAENEDCQVIFGATLDDKLGDAVKVTVIATGFHPESTHSVGDLRSELAAQFHHADPPAAVHPQPGLPAPPPQAAQPNSDELDPEPMLDLDDLDTPAYLRQGRLLN
jgi:cell division protein FtsZ